MGPAGRGRLRPLGGPCHHVGGLARVSALHYVGGYNGLLGKQGQSCPHGDTMGHDEPSSTSVLPLPGCRDLWVLKAGEGHLNPPTRDGVLGGLQCRTDPRGDAELGAARGAPVCRQGWPVRAWLQCPLARTRLYLAHRDSGEQHGECAAARQAGAGGGEPREAAAGLRLQGTIPWHSPFQSTPPPKSLAVPLHPH